MIATRVEDEEKFGIFIAESALMKMIDTTRYVNDFSQTADWQTLRRGVCHERDLKIVWQTTKMR